jgi:RHS repeat-associated protein
VILNVPKSFTFTYDFEDRPTQTSITYNGTNSTTTYVIDGDGHRVGKSTAGVLTKYVFDGDTVIGETTGSTETFHLPGIGFATFSAQNYYQENALGSTLDVRTNAGALSSRNEYDGYGITYTQVAGPHSEFGFAGAHGYQTDGDTSLQLLGHRYYVPQIGRFLTTDPTGQKDDLNLYGYCANNPLENVDPTGSAAQAIPIGPIAGTGAAVVVRAVAVRAVVATGTALAAPEVAVVAIGVAGVYVGHKVGVYLAGKMVTHPESIWTANEVEKANLPTTGEFPYIPPKKWKSGNALPQADGEPGTILDDAGNIWKKGKNHHFPNDPREWDVTNPKTHPGEHLNVGLGSSDTPGKLGGPTRW